MINIAKNVVRAALRARGIELVSYVARFGINPWEDIRRLANVWNRDLRIAFDVGANDGGTTDLLLRNFPNARVLSFEPQSSMVAKLEGRFGREPRVRTERMALCNNEGTVQLFEYEDDKIASMAPNAPFAVRFNGAPKATQVACTTIDNFCRREDVDRIDILKIDTEGNDHIVLEGASEMLAAGRISFVFVEFNTLDPTDGQFGGALSLTNRLLQPEGYRFIASYSDYIVTEDPMFSVSNALFALPPRR